MWQWLSQPFNAKQVRPYNLWKKHRWSSININMTPLPLQPKHLPHCHTYLKRELIIRHVPKKMIYKHRFSLNFYPVDNTNFLVYSVPNLCVLDIMFSVQIGHNNMSLDNWPVFKFEIRHISVIVKSKLYTWYKTTQIEKVRWASLELHMYIWFI